MNVSEMWESYLGSIGETPETTARTFQAWSFGSVPDKLAALVLQGDKRATTSLLCLYGAEPVPNAGDISIILNSEDSPVCIIETTKVTVMPFCEVPAEFAFREGEGDKSLSYWQQVHREVFSFELSEMNRQFTDDMPVVCEEFEVVYRP